MIKEQQIFFENKADNYHDLIKHRKNRVKLSRFIIPRMGAFLLEVGNGGVKDFTSPHTVKYVGLDFSLTMLKKGDSDVNKVCGDAMSLPLRRNTLMYSSMLHHLTQKSFATTQQRIITALIEGHDCLKEDGNILVIEPCMNKVAEKLERVVFFSSRLFFIFSAFQRYFSFHQLP